MVATPAGLMAKPPAAPEPTQLTRILQITRRTLLYLTVGQVTRFCLSDSGLPSQLSNQHY